MKTLHRVTGALLFDTGRKALRSANLRGAGLCRADLYGANLSGANLSGANLSGANLSGAAGVIGLASPDRWPAFAYYFDGAVRVQVGCKNFTIDEARAYWHGKEDRREVLAAVEYAATVAGIRGWSQS